MNVGGITLPDRLCDDLLGIDAQVLAWDVMVQRNEQRIEFWPPHRPERQIGCDDPDCCPDGPRILTDDEYAAACERYELAWAEWVRCGGVMHVKSAPDTFVGTAWLEGGGTASVIFDDAWQAYVLSWHS